MYVCTQEWSFTGGGFVASFNPLQVPQVHQKRPNSQIGALNDNNSDVMETMQGIWAVCVVQICA